MNRYSQIFLSSGKKLSKTLITILLSILGIVGAWGTDYLSNYHKLKRGSISRNKLR